jgi:hypothetical protein
MGRLPGLFLIFALVTPAGRGQTGSVDGLVVDADGKASAQATVSFMSLDKIDNGHRLPSTSTHEDGRFMLSSLPIGIYRVYAWKEASGIPNTRDLLFERSNPHYSQITVKNNEIAHAGNIALPPAYGRLTLRVVDSKTKSPIPLARCTLTRTQAAGIMYATDSTSGGFSFLLPDSPISLKITSPGYKDWSYVELSSAKNYLVLPPGSERTILVTLEAEHSRR